MGPDLRLALALLTVVALSQCQAKEPDCKAKNGIQNAMKDCVKDLTTKMQTMATGIFAYHLTDEVKSKYCGDDKGKLTTALKCIADVNNKCDGGNFFNNQANINYVNEVCKPDSDIDVTCIESKKTDLDNCNNPNANFTNCHTIPDQMLCAIKALKECKCMSTKLIVNFIYDDIMDQPVYKMIEANCMGVIKSRRDLVKCAADDPKEFELVNNVVPWIDCTDGTSQKDATKNCLRGTDMGEKIVKAEGFVSLASDIADNYCDNGDLLKKVDCVINVEKFCLQGMGATSTPIDTFVKDLCKNKKDVNSKCMENYQDKIKGCVITNPNECSSRKANIKCKEDKLRECNCISSKIVVGYSYNSIVYNPLMKNLEKDCLADMKSQVDAVVCDANNPKNFNQANGLGLTLPSLVLSLLLAALFTRD